MGSQTDPQDGQDVHSRYSKEIHRTLTELPSWIYAVTPGLNWWLNTIWNSHCKTNCWHHIFGIGNYTRWLTKFRISRLLKMKDAVSLEQCIIWFCHICDTNFIHSPQTVGITTQEPRNDGGISFIKQTTYYCWSRPWDTLLWTNYLSFIRNLWF